MLLPRIFEALRSARVNATLVALNTIKTGVAQYLAKHHSLVGANPLDETLVKEGYIDHPFNCSLAEDSAVYAVTASVVGTGESGPTRYDLDGDGSVDTMDAQYVIEAQLSTVSLKNAISLKEAIDGEFSAENPLWDKDANGDQAAEQTKGRVIWTLQGPGVVYVYIYLDQD